jgi:ATP synthase protein I
LAEWIRVLVPGMSSTGMTAQTSSPAVQSLGLQLLATLLVAAALLPLGRAPALSALLGGGIAGAGNLLAIALVFRRYRAAAPGGLAVRMMGAEMARLLLVAVGFGAVFARLAEPSILPLFGTFLLVHLLPVWWLHRASIQATKR